MNKLEFYGILGKNLERERFELNMTQADFAKKIDMSLSAYKRFINGETHHMDLYNMFKLYELTGKMPHDYVNPLKDSRFLKIVSKMENLSFRQLMYVNAVVEFENYFRIENEGNIEDYITVFIPTGNFEDGMIYDSSNTIKVNVSEYRKRFGDRIHYGVKITSNHLHPVYNMNDILLISKEPIRDGDIGLFLEKSTGKFYIRKFRQTQPCILEPINEYGIPITVDSYDLNDLSKWIKFGKVLSKMR